MNIRDTLAHDVLVTLEKFGVKVKSVEITRNSDKKFGDFSTNIALKVSREFKQSPIETAIRIADSIKNPSYIKRLEVKEPGFINFHINEELWQKQVSLVLKEAERYGANDKGKGKKTRIEFISANPTGPLHFGNARGGPIGDVLASVLAFAGYEVLREYYHNDVGEQIRKLGESIINIKNGEKAEDQEYKGEYVVELAKKLQNAKSADEAGQEAVKILGESIISDSKELGINFDKIYRESEFIASGKTKEVIEKLNNKGYLKPNDGAVWFAPSDEFLKDRETVVVKTDETYTYFANDIAYHDLKFAEGVDLVIDIFGANHHGHVPRLQAAVKALGYDVSNFVVILYQWVRFKKGGDIVKMSKRSGTFITASEVLEDIGRDAVRFFLLMYDNDSPIDFDLDLAKEKSTKNPVYYVQYACARIASILEKAEKSKDDVDYSLISTKWEIDLIKQMTKFPEIIDDISSNFAVHHLTLYSISLADAFHKFYENCKVVGEEKPLADARVNLLLATQITLKNTLKLLGVSAPDKM